MKQLKLTNLAKDELKKTQMNCIKGGNLAPGCGHQCRMEHFTRKYGPKSTSKVVFNYA